MKGCDDMTVGTMNDVISTIPDPYKLEEHLKEYKVLNKSRGSALFMVKTCKIAVLLRVCLFFDIFSDHQRQIKAEKLLVPLPAASEIGAVPVFAYDVTGEEVNIKVDFQI